MRKGAGSARRDRPPFSFLLVHSPLVGPRSWEPTAAGLADRGVRVAVPSLVDALSATTDRHDALAAAAVDALVPGPWLVGVHSGAGALVPSLVERLGSDCVGVVFVDALLPHPGRSWVAGAPPDLVAGLEDLVDDAGLLAPWHTWFGPEALAGLVPDAAARAHVTADIPRVPLAYLEAVAPPHRGWESLPCGYLRLSEAYVDEEAEAERRGWPTATLGGHHLSAVTDPEPVVEALLALSRLIVGR